MVSVGATRTAAGALEEYELAELADDEEVTGAEDLSDEELEASRVPSVGANSSPSGTDSSLGRLLTLRLLVGFVR